jgi:hypothetical protein
MQGSHGTRPRSTEWHLRERASPILPPFAVAYEDLARSRAPSDGVVRIRKAEVLRRREAERAKARKERIHERRPDQSAVHKLTTRLIAGTQDALQTRDPADSDRVRVCTPFVQFWRLRARNASQWANSSMVLAQNSRNLHKRVGILPGGSFDRPSRGMRLPP